MSFSYCIDVHDNNNEEKELVLLNIDIWGLELRCDAMRVDIAKWDNFHIDKTISIPIDTHDEAFLRFTIYGQDRLCIEFVGSGGICMRIERDLPQNFYAMVREVYTEMIEK